MRSKIIAVNSVIVLIVGLCTFALLRISQDGDRSDSKRARDEVARAWNVAKAKLELDAFRAERWLERSLEGEGPRAVFQAGTPQARADAATEQANRLRIMARQSLDLVVSFVAFVDERGIVLGRDGTNLARGEDWAAAHPGLRRDLETGRAGSELWTSPGTGELVLASHVPVREAAGEVLGWAVLATPVNDERLGGLSETAGGSQLFVLVPGDDGLQFRAQSAASAALGAFLEQQDGNAAAMTSVGSGRLSIVPEGPGGRALAIGPLDGSGDGRSAVLIAAVEPDRAGGSGLLVPIAGSIGLGLLLVAIGGWLLGSYVSQPIEKLEDGVLAILNGSREHRFDIEHAELGGVVFRLNLLLNQLFGGDEGEEEAESELPPDAKARP